MSTTFFTVRDAGNVLRKIAQELVGPDLFRQQTVIAGSTEAAVADVSDAEPSANTNGLHVRAIGAAKDSTLTTMAAMLVAIFDKIIDEPATQATLEAVRALLAGGIGVTQGAAGGAKWLTRDDYATGACYATIDGTSEVATLVIDPPAQAVLCENDGEDMSLVNPFGAAATDDDGIPCRDGMQKYVPVACASLSHYVPTGSKLRVWVLRR